MSFIDELKRRIDVRNLRSFSNDNVSEIFENEEEYSKYIAELTTRFEHVLDGLLIDIGNDPNANGTGKRLAKMYVNEIMMGRYHPAPDVTAFPNDGSHGTKPYCGMLVVRADIKSMCSHHHQQVFGTAFIGIIPGKKVIGLSKYSRIAHHCARRGTLQEELTVDIKDAISAAAETNDIAVYIQAQHGCCIFRGISTNNSNTQTTVLDGQFNQADVKKEFFDNISLQLRSTAGI